MATSQAAVLDIDMDIETATFEECVQAARDAEEARRFDAALFAWEKIRVRFPAAPVGYSGAGTALRELDRLDEAEAILDEGLQKVPGDERTMVAHAWVAHSRGDLLEADRRWNAVREAFPDCVDGYYGGGDVLRNLGRYDEADAVYRTAFAMFPMMAHVLGDFAAVAQSRDDLEEAARRWTTLHTLFPDDVHGYLRQALAYRERNLFQEAEALLAQALRRFPGEAALLIDFAALAVVREEWSEALRRWDAVATRFHGRVDGYLGASQALTALGRFAEAETVLTPALRMFPDLASVAVAYAWSAHYRQDYAAAVQRWDSVRARFPRLSCGYTGGAESLLEAGNVADAAALIEVAQSLFPDEIDVAAAYARSAAPSQDGDESLRRWALVLERFPGTAAAQAGYGQACLRAGQLDEAEIVLAAAIGANGEDPDLNRLYAECAALRRDWAAADTRWRRLTDLFPGRVISWIGRGEMLRSAGWFDAAEAVLEAALERFPGHRDLERELAMTATARRDWPVAFRRWEALKERHPRDFGVASGIADALWHARQDLGVILSDPNGGVVPFVIPEGLLHPAAAEDTNSLRDLLMHFESLGDSCEFGMVQRRFGAEPISLLRWTSTPLQRLVLALDSDFAGVGEAEHTIVTVSDEGEYTTMDRRYHMNSHTFTLATAEPIARFTAQYLRRMQYLRRKLLDDLATGDKVFVYKSEQGVSDDEGRALFAAIRRHGGHAALLCVRLETEEHPRGTVTRLDDGLFMGHIDRFSTVDIHVDAWIDLCRQTRALASTRALDQSES